MSSSPWSVQASFASSLFGHASKRSANLAALMVLIVCVASAVFTVWQHESASTERASRRQALHQNQARLEQRVKPVAKAPVLLSSDEVAAHNQAVQYLNIPWSLVLDTFERQTPGDVGLTLLEPDGKKASVRIQAEAKRIDALLAYSNELATDRAIEEMRLLQHETNDQDSNLPARLSFDLRFAPDVWAGRQ